MSKLIEKAQAVIATIPNVRHEPYAQGNGLPWFIYPTDDRLANDSAAATKFIVEHRDKFDAIRAAIGAIVLRGFALRSTQDFNDIVSGYPEPQFGYVGGGTARSNIEGRVYQSTVAPPDMRLPLHQEMAYLPDYPGALAFFAHVASPVGGATIICDMREFTRRLPADLVEKVARRKVRYIRRFRPESWASGDAAIDTMLYRTWNASFGLSTKPEIEDECRKMGLDFHWFDGDFLETSYVTEGVRPDLTTGELTWFNQITAQAMRPEAMAPGMHGRVMGALGDKQPPLEQVLGDGEPLTEGEYRLLYELFDELTVAFPWENGDVMFVDNIAVAHGRDPFEGPRDIQVALIGL